MQFAYPKKKCKVDLCVSLCVCVCLSLYLSIKLKESPNTRAATFRFQIQHHEITLVCGFHFFF